MEDFPPEVAANLSWTSLVCTSAALEALKGQTQRKKPPFSEYKEGRLQSFHTASVSKKSTLKQSKNSDTGKIRGLDGKIDQGQNNWKELWQTNQGKLSFLLCSVTDLLPTPSNLKIWGSEEDPSCSQCGAVPCTLNHILTGCPKALAEGRYRWRHDKVLMEIAKWVEQQRVKANNKQAQPPEVITFVREGDKARKTSTQTWSCYPGA